MLFITVVILFARVANVESISELVFTALFRRKTNLCRALVLLQLPWGTRAPGTWLRTVLQNSQILPL